MSQRPWIPAATTPLGATAALIVAAMIVPTVASRQGMAAANPAAPQSATAAGATGAMSYGDPFWKLWGDGQAELAAYDLTISRYGQPRQGLAVAIFVTETFSNSARVKADPGKHPKSDEFPVLKLNLVQDFATGIYDYNLMTCAFVALEPVNGRPAGATTKVSFSSQEWCGQVYQQALFDPAAVRATVHSYFDGEADQQVTLAYPQDGISEDALLIWARGLAWPALQTGESRTVPLLRAARISRLHHVPLDWETARLSRGAQTESVVVPAGRFDCEILTALIGGGSDGTSGGTGGGASDGASSGASGGTRGAASAGTSGGTSGGGRDAARDAGRTWTIYVEQATPHRVVKWERSDGETAVLVKSDRLKYWEMNGLQFITALARLGLSPRPVRMP
jgi:hypothetical protein